MFAGHSQTALLAGASLPDAATATQALVDSSIQIAGHPCSQPHMDSDLQSYLEICGSRQFSSIGKD